MRWPNIEQCLIDVEYVEDTNDIWCCLIMMIMEYDLRMTISKGRITKLDISDLGSLITMLDISPVKQCCSCYIMSSPFTLWEFVTQLLKMAIETVSFPIKHDVCFFPYIELYWCTRGCNLPRLYDILHMTRAPKMKEPRTQLIISITIVQNTEIWD